MIIIYNNKSLTYHIFVFYPFINLVSNIKVNSDISQLGWSDLLNKNTGCHLNLNFK